MPELKRLIITLGALTALAAGPAGAAGSLDDAADTAEAFVYGRESKNEDLLREISDPDSYESMAESRGESDRKLNENVKVENVEITEVKGDRAVAKATYKRHNTKGRKSADVHLKRVDGKWTVTTPPEAAD